MLVDAAVEDDPVLVHAHPVLRLGPQPPGIQTTGEDDHGDREGPEDAQSAAAAGRWALLGELDVEVVAELADAMATNLRLRVRYFAADDSLPVVPSVVDIWGAANWFEREAFDLLGIVFEGHPDLRRILTDYGFIGHPMRKDFPVSGHVEMRYDAQTQRVIYQPVTIEPREITPRVVREDNYGGLH